MSVTSKEILTRQLQRDAAGKTQTLDFLLGVLRQAAKRDERMREKPPPIGSVQLDEQLLRKIFQKMDNCI